MYTSLDDDDDGFYDNYISRGLCGTGPINNQEFSILDAIQIGLAPKSGGQCWICPLGYMYVPLNHPDREQVQATLLKIANKGTHPMYPNLPFFELSKQKILQLATVHFEIMIASPIIEMLENISMNKLSKEVKWFVSSCNNLDIDQCTLIGSSDSPPMCCTTDDFYDLYFLSDEPPPTEGYANYNKKQIELCAAMLRNDTDDAVRAVYDGFGLDFVSDDDNDPAVSEATPDDDNEDINFSYDDDVIEATPDVIPIPTPNLQVHQQLSQQYVQRSAMCRPSYICYPQGTILCVLNRKRGSMLLDNSSEQTLFASLSALPVHSLEQKTLFLELLAGVLLADFMDVNTSFIDPIPVSPPFKREV